MTPSQESFLLGALHIETVLAGAYFTTGRRYRRATALELSAKGYLSEQWAYRVDGDGFMIHPERYGPAWQLTAKGRKKARILLARENRALQRRFAEFAATPAEETK